MSLEKEEAIIKVSEEKECNYVSLGKKVLVNLMEDTAKKEHVLKGYTFHESNGKVEEGTYEPALQDKEIELTENETTTISADDGFVGLREVQITTNVQPVLTTKTITENGTYYAEDDEVQGYSSVEVNVEGGSEPIVKLPVRYFEIYDGTILGLSTEGRQALARGEMLELNLPDSYDQDPATEEELTFYNIDSLQQWFYSNSYPMFTFEYYGETIIISSSRSFDQHYYDMRSIISTNGSIVITHITLGETREGDTYNITVIGDSAIADGSSWQSYAYSIDLPKYLERIEDNNFLQLSTLLKISEIPATCTYIGQDVFISQSGLFTSTLSLKELKVNENNPVYDSRDNCNAIIETASNTLLIASKNTVIPNSVTEIAEYAFRNQRITEINIPESVQSIGANAFQYCISLTSFTFPEAVSTLSYGILLGCQNLTEVSFSSNVNSIGYNCFGNTSLTDIYYGGTLAQFENIRAALKENSGISGTITVHCMDGDTIIDDSVGQMVIEYQDGTTKTVGVSTELLPLEQYDIDLSPTSEIVSISIPEGVTSIGEYAFDVLNYELGNHVLSTISLPSTLESIGHSAFSRLSALQSLGNNDNRLPYNLLYIGDDAFSNCSSLGKIVIPANISSLQNGCFRNCGDLQITLKYPYNVVYVYFSETFSNTTLTAIYVPSNLVEQYREAEFWSQYASIIQADPTEVSVSQVALRNIVTGDYTYFDGSGNYYNLSGLELEANTSYVLSFTLSNGITKTGLLPIYGYNFPNEDYESYITNDGNSINILQQFTGNYSLYVNPDAINYEQWEQAGSLEIIYQEPGLGYYMILKDTTNNMEYPINYHDGNEWSSGGPIPFELNHNFELYIADNDLYWEIAGMPFNITPEAFIADENTYYTLTGGNGGYIHINKGFEGNFRVLAPSIEQIQSDGFAAFESCTITYFNDL